MSAAVDVSTDNAAPARSAVCEATAHARREGRVGVAYGVAAFGWWGFVTIYFKAVAAVPPLEVLSHRVVLSMVLLWGVLAAKRRIGLAFKALGSGRTMLILCGSTAMIACNWLVFIWAVGHEHVTQASLGYFINPLLNVLLGYLFLGERLRRLQKISVALATVGVVILTIHFGEVPTVALILPATFGMYGLIRKVIRVDALAGLTIETTLLTPLALTYVAFAYGRGDLAFGALSSGIDVLLLSSGIVTAVPLLCFLNAARRLRLSTLGFLQYLAPSVQLWLGTAVYGEAFTPVHLLSFGLVWAGLAVYATDAVRASRG